MKFQERIKQVQQAYDEVLSKKDIEHKKLLEDADSLMCDSELKLEDMKREQIELKARIESLLSVEKEKVELETRVCELGVSLDRVRHKELKMKSICEQFKL